MLRRVIKGFKYLKKNGMKATIKRTVSFLDRRWGVGRFIRQTTRSHYADYVHYIEEYNKSLKNGSNPDFVKKTDSIFERQEADSKIIAWYLPQYYRIDVNDKFHGEGFTEWTNSSQAFPLYKGHYQPHIPFDVGYYNLLQPENMQRQIQLAKQYGIYGFCFHWYWFSGKRTMEKPVEMFLTHKELDMPFCLDWATENWTALWDGENNGLIFEQKLEKGDDEKFMDDILPYMKDSRYIKIDGKPVLVIYRCTVFERKRFVKLLDNFRARAKKEGFPGLYIMLSNTRNFDDDVHKWGADALVEFPPIYFEIKKWQPEGYLNPNFKGNIFDMDDFTHNRKYLHTYKNHNVFRSALTAFDNTARHAHDNNGRIFHGATPSTYKSWLKDIMAENKNTHGKEDNIVFVNSWNEWAEGSHLEPDVRYGYAYLQATKEAIEEVRVDEHIIDRKITECLALGEKITFYVHCIESMGDIVACEPIARYLKSKVPESKVVWIVKEGYKKIVEFNPNIDGIITVDILSSSMRLIKEKAREKASIIIDCHYDFRTSSVTNEVHRNLNNPAVNAGTYFWYGSLLGTFCLSAGLPNLKDAPKFYLDPSLKRDDRLPEKYVVVHCRSAEECKQWKKNDWNLLVKSLSAQGLNVVEVGLERFISEDAKNYHDFTFEHDLQKIAKIISEAQLFIGIDSGFAHFANCFDVYGILIFGKYKNFNHPMPYTGNYAEGMNSEIVWADRGKSVDTIPVERVLDAVWQWRNRTGQQTWSSQY